MHHLQKMAALLIVTLAVAACGGDAAQDGNGNGADGGGSVSLVAKGISFDTDEIEVEGAGEVTVSFDNQDSGIPHNLAVYQDDSAEDAVFQGKIIEGPATTDYTFSVPEAGEYFFRCDVHPTEMTGTLIVE